MFLALRFAEGLLAAHVWIALAYVMGALFFPPAPEDIGGSSAAATCRFVCTCAVGFCLVGLCAFILAVVGAFSIPVLCIWLFEIAAIAVAARRSAPWRGDFWARCGRLVWRSCSWSTITAYAWMLFLAFPAVIPTYASDGNTYHIAYAQDIANNHRLTIDPFLMFPLYANNFELFYAITLLFHGGQDVINFVTWAAGTLAVLGICGAVESFAPLPRAAMKACSLIAVLAVTLSPMYLTWIDTGFVDIPDGFFALATIIALQRCVATRRREWLAMAALAAGFLCGMKLSFVLLLLPFGVLIYMAGTYASLGKKSKVAAVALLLIVAVPWYVRNAVVDGDPIPPILNIALKGNDRYFTATEWNALVAVTRPTSSLIGVATLPWRMFIDPQTSEFQEQGVSALSLFVFLPLFVLFWRTVVLRAGPMWPAVSLYAVALGAFVVYWLYTAHLARYTMLFYPALAVFVVVLFSYACRWFITTAVLTEELGAPGTPLAKGGSIALSLIACLTLVLPTPLARPNFFRQYFEGYYKDLPVNYTSPEQYRETFVTGYSSEQSVVTELRRNNILAGTVYVADTGQETQVFYRRDGYMSAGNWSGPSAYGRLVEAAEIGEVQSYLDGLGAAAILVNAGRFSPGEIGQVVAALDKAQYTATIVNECACILFIRRDQNKGRAGSGGHFPMAARRASRPRPGR